MNSMKLLVATRNKGKVRELAELLRGLPLQLASLDEFPDVAEVEETGETFAENAALKAAAYSRETGLWSIADDSGLVVDALGGAPGVHSARYAGDNASDADRTAKLLNELSAANAVDRRARFICSIAVSDENGELRHLAEGVCEGSIADAPQGVHGFGYDPVFVPDGHRQTFGELPSSVKDKISHRADAIAKIIRFLRHLKA